MERISQKEAAMFVALKEDFTNLSLEDCKYFTLSPSKTLGEGWEDVTYYTGRTKNTLGSSKNRNLNSWVYVLSNPTMPNILKIGFTDRTPEDRVKEISRSTGVALPYEVEFAFHCYDGMRLEGEIHKNLSKYRLSNNKEHFSVSLDEAKKTIINLGQNYI